MKRYVPVFQQYAPASPDIYDLEEMCERSGELVVRLVRQRKERLKIFFSDHLGFRKAGESDSLVTLREIAVTAQAGRSFYIVENSDYVRWFVDQSHGIRRMESLQHIAIVTIDDIIDVIALSLPSISVP
jgi:hypothetical protein